MIIKLNADDLMLLFRKMDRDYYSYEAYKALLEILPEDWEVDVIAICCDYTEYSLEELKQQYGTLEELEEKTIVYHLSETYLVLEC